MATKFTLTAAHLATLVAISGATANGGNYFISAADGKPLADNGYIEVNPGLLDDNKNAAARLTDKGRTAIPADGNQPAPAAPAVSFFIAQNVALPPVKRASSTNKGAQESKYPLKNIPLHGAAFVAAADMEAAKKVSKQFGSIVSNYNTNHTEGWLTTRLVADGKAAGFIGQNEDGTPNEDAYAGVAGIGIYHRPYSEFEAEQARKAEAKAARDAKAATAAGGNGGGTTGGGQTQTN